MTILKKKIALVLCFIIIIGIWLAPDHGSVVETINLSDDEKNVIENVIVYKPWKEDVIIKEIQDRKKLLNEVPDTMIVHLYYINKDHEYKTITITYKGPESSTDPGYFLAKPQYRKYDVQRFQQLGKFVPGRFKHHYQTVFKYKRFFCAGICICSL